MNRGMEGMGGKVVKKYRIYERRCRARAGATGPTRDPGSVPSGG